MFNLMLLLSGPCQFPTLGFVVSRYTQVKSFTPETFWYIFLSLSRPTSSSSAAEETQFNWRRGHIFDWEVAVALYQHVLGDSMARVMSVVQKPTKKWYVFRVVHFECGNVDLLDGQETAAAYYGRATEIGIQVTEIGSKEAAGRKTFCHSGHEEC